MTLTGATSPSSWPTLIEMHLGKRGLHHTRADLGPGAASGRSGRQGPPPSPVSRLVHRGHSAVERTMVGRDGEKELRGKEDCSLRHRTPDLGKRGTRPRKSTGLFLPGSQPFHVAETTERLWRPQASPSPLPETDTWGPPAPLPLPLLTGQGGAWVLSLLQHRLWVRLKAPLSAAFPERSSWGRPKERGRTERERERWEGLRDTQRGKGRGRAPREQSPRRHGGRACSRGAQGPGKRP